MEEREGISVSQAELKTRLVTVREEENAFQQDPIKRFLQIFTKKEITPLDVPLIHHPCQRLNASPPSTWPRMESLQRPGSPALLRTDDLRKCGIPQTKI